MLACSSASFGAGLKTSDQIKDGKPGYGGFEAQVIRIIDADTLKLRVFLWPGLEKVENYRSRGVDAPELSSPGCDNEKRLAQQAKASIARKFPVESWVYIDNIGRDKYSGRWVADIYRWSSDRFKTLTAELLESNGKWGWPYDGTGPRHDWCTEAAE